MMDQALSALVMHDLKNALALLEADLEQLNHHPDLPEEAHKAYQRCVELKGRLISFLTLYKHEQGRLKPNIGETELADFLEDMIAGSASVAMGSKHGHSIEVRVTKDKIKIAPGVKHKGIASFDEYLVDVALESALNNSIRYAASKVDIWFEQEADKLTFFVLDDGSGLTNPEKTQPKSATEKPASTGLGLTLCHAVTDAHGGGSVSLTNAPGGGALFRMELRLAG
jgi:signal transduction histidine kinase